ncbi:hypothetical protein H4219_001098 [Mycoemilia scoparia]|uniref:Uncharacterized protein n=1 Tax=Mycoemilia scoparia TaxID=417184 RepID=A0A9W8A7D8_9FUNG|nr:hypothetical protein H4219_001098 [Mycoemilia scoparia]
MYRTVRNLVVSTLFLGNMSGSHIQNKENSKTSSISNNKNRSNNKNNNIINVNSNNNSNSNNGSNKGASRDRKRRRLDTDLRPSKQQRNGVQPISPRRSQKSSRRKNMETPTPTGSPRKSRGLKSAIKSIQISDKQKSTRASLKRDEHGRSPMGSNTRTLRSRHQDQQETQKLQKPQIPPEFTTMVIVIGQTLEGCEERHAGAQIDPKTQQRQPLFRPETILEDNTHRLYHENQLPLFEVIKPETEEPAAFSEGPAGAVRQRRRASMGKSSVQIDEDLSDSTYLQRHRRPEFAEKRARNREIELYEYARWQEGNRSSGSGTASASYYSQHQLQASLFPLPLLSPTLSSRARSASKVLEAFISMACELTTYRSGRDQSQWFSLPESVFKTMMDERRLRSSATD